MNLYLTSAYDLHPGLTTVCEAAALDSVGKHRLADHPDEADAIMFIENTQFDDLLFRKLSTHRLLQERPGQCFMYNEMDRPWEVLPGLYTCMNQRHYNAQRQRPFAYLSTPNPKISQIAEQTFERRWLFSFMGAMSHRCRRAVMKLDHSRAYLKDTSDFNVWNTSAQELEQRAMQYSQVVGESEFVLCPRGIGTSSIRLYETLEAGRAPVIIADDWVAPEETDWRFAVRVEEGNIGSIPGLLQSLSGEAEERGRAARAAWEQCYAPATLFNSLGDAIERLCRPGSALTPKASAIQWNKWIASSGVITRTAVQKIKGQR